MANREEIIKLASEYIEEGKKFVIENRMREAEKSILRAKELCEEETDEYILANISNILGVIYGAIEEDAECAAYYMDALMHVKKGLELEKDTQSENYTNLSNLIGILYNNIGSRYQLNNDYEKAFEYFKKASESIDYELARSDEFMRRRAYVILLNYAQCSMNMEDYEAALEYAKRAKEYMPVSEDGRQDFTYGVIYAEIMWKLGETDWVWNELDNLIQGALDNSDGKDYMESMNGLCSLLSWMKAFYQWKRVIDIMDGFKSEFNSVAYDILVEETYMRYYEMLDETDRYREKCETLVKLYQKQQDEKKTSQAQAITMRLAFIENEEQRLKADERALTDKLTGVGNRHKLERDINDMLPELVKKEGTIGFGIVDIDFFKLANDTYGHLQGDECLKAVSEIIRESISEKVGENGEVYRFGGDEFVILIKDATEDNIAAIAELIKWKLGEKAIPNVQSKVVPVITLSQGYVCVSPKEGDDADMYMEQADKTLYSVKESGRNNYSIK